MNATEYVQVRSVKFQRSKCVWKLSSLRHCRLPRLLPYSLLHNILKCWTGVNFCCSRASVQTSTGVCPEASFLSFLEHNRVVLTYSEATVARCVGPQKVVSWSVNSCLSCSFKKKKFNLHLIFKCTLHYPLPPRGRDCSWFCSLHTSYLQENSKLPMSQRAKKKKGNFEEITGRNPSIKDSEPNLVGIFTDAYKK